MINNYVGGVDVSDPEDAEDAEDTEDTEDKSDEKQEDIITDNGDVIHIDEDHYIHDSDHDEFCKESLASIMRVEESFGKGVEICTNQVKNKHTQLHKIGMKKI
eukprot:511787-Ditylum_brightwellii.AAC.1